MASWTQSALALLTSMPGAQKLVEAAYPGAGRIAACHVQAWAELCKQWTRNAISQAQNLSQVARKMVELAAQGQHVSGHHVSHWLSHPQKDMPSQSIEWLTPEPMCADADLTPQPSVPGKAQVMETPVRKEFGMWEIRHTWEPLEPWQIEPSAWQPLEPGKIEPSPAWQSKGLGMGVPSQKQWPSIPAILVIGMCGPLPALASTCAKIPPIPPPAYTCHIM